MELTMRADPESGGKRSRGGPTITVAICTRDRPRQLVRAVRSVLEQSEAPDEIIVVDNAPSDESTREAFDRVTGGVDGAEPTTRAIRYLRERTAGLDFARNHALLAATGQVVAFLDDDAVAGPEWVRETRRAFAEYPDLRACMGKVVALSLESAGARLFEANGGFARGDEPQLLPGAGGGFPIPLIARSIGVGSGCSMAVSRRKALQLGGFEEALDMGAALPGGGDLDMIWRILEGGGKVLYAPGVQAMHEHRTDPDEVITQIADHHRGLVAMLVHALRRAPARRRLPILAFLGWRLSKPGLRLIRRAVGRDPIPMRGLIRIWWSCWRGIGSYFAARAEVRRRRELAAEAVAPRLATPSPDSGTNSAAAPAAAPRTARPTRAKGTG